MRLENLRAILFHLDYENLSVGWSDHTCNPGVIYAMWPLDAIEFHLDLEGKGAEFEQGHCWLPGPAQTMIETVKTMRLVWGNDSGASADVESKERLWRADPSDGLRPLKEIRHTL
jgi:N-acetylneuraminate synthase